MKRRWMPLLTAFGAGALRRLRSAILPRRWESTAQAFTMPSETRRRFLPALLSGMLSDRCEVIFGDQRGRALPKMRSATSFVFWLKDRLQTGIVAAA